MSRLQELIDTLCPDGVEYKPLEECCNVLDRKRKPVTKGAREAGEYPYYGANGIQDYVSDYIFDGTFILVGEDGSVQTESGKPVVNWAKGKIWVNNHAHIVEEKEGVLLRYLYYFLQTINVHDLIHGNIPKLTGGDFRALKIAVPPIKIQQEIVRILDNFTELTAELISKLTTEIIARKTQYEYYLDSMILKSQNINSKSLNDIAKVYDGTHQTPDYKDEGIPFISVENISNIYASQKYITQEDYDRYKIKPKKNDLFMTRIGSIGKCAVMTENCDLAYYVSLALIRPDNSIIDTKYLKFYIESIFGRKELAKRTLHNAVPIKVNKDDIGKIMIKYPFLDEQVKIVDILEQFDRIYESISKELSAEIEARQKQYEYYLDILFSFKELNS